MIVTAAQVALVAWDVQHQQAQHAAVQIAVVL
jgi:hypothetical protein